MCGCYGSFEWCSPYVNWFYLYSISSLLRCLAASSLLPILVSFPVCLPCVHAAMLWQGHPVHLFTSPEQLHHFTMFSLVHWLCSALVKPLLDHAALLLLSCTCATSCLQPCISFYTCILFVHVSSNVAYWVLGFDSHVHAVSPILKLAMPLCWVVHIW